MTVFLSRAIFLTILSIPLWASATSAQEPLKPERELTFVSDVAPFLRKHCYDCHGKEEPEAGLSLEKYKESSKIQTDFEVWEKVLRMLTERQMPPKDIILPDETELQHALSALRMELARFDCGQARRPGRVTIRRLNRPEYNNTIRDLVGLDLKLAADFPSDDVGSGFDNIGDVLSLPPLLIEKYFAAAETIIEKAFESEEGRQKILVAPMDRRGSTRQNIEAFAARAFRREITEEESDRFSELAEEAREAGASREEALKGVFTAILVSPHFLFRVEADPAPEDEDGIRELDDYELASRLSYFLWSSMPDEELFNLAGEGKLRDLKVLEAQVKRMLKDPKAKALTKNFAGQWLQLRSLTGINPNAEQFPKFDAELRSAMRQETELFFEDLVQNDKSILDFLNADYTFLNERLAKHYGVENIEGDEFREVKLPRERRGVLTHASILLITSNPTRTSPVKRGKWILDNILDEPPPPPPADIEELSEDAETLGSLRERMRQHRSNESCAVCHTKMDALGFGLENFDVIGSWRDKEGRFDIDASGELPGGLKFNGASEMVEILVEQKRDAFCQCLARKLLTYALGRELQSFDRCAVNEIVDNLQKQDYRFSALVTSIVLSDPFRMREAKGEN